SRHGVVALGLRLIADVKVTAVAVVIEPVVPLRLEHPVAPAAPRTGLMALDVTAGGFLEPLRGRPVTLRVHQLVPPGRDSEGGFGAGGKDQGEPSILSGGVNLAARSTLSAGSQQVFLT